MDMRVSTTPPASGNPEASSKTTKVSYMLSPDEIEEIELRQLDELEKRLIARGIIKPE